MKQAVPTEAVLSRPAAVPAARLSAEDEGLFRALLERFAVHAETCFRFSRDIYLRTRGSPEADVEPMSRRSLSIARRVFGEGLLEILAVIYLKKSVGFQELAGILGGVSTGVLRKKLRALEASGLTQSAGVYERPEATHYALTHKGTIIARLGEPVFLYLRLAEGWTRTDIEERTAAHAAETSEGNEPAADA